MKKKLLTIIGIVIVVAGVCIFLYPIIRQAYTAHKQKIYMEDVKQQILASMNEQNEALEAEANQKTAESVTDTDNSTSSANSTESSSDSNTDSNLENTSEDSSGNNSSAADNNTEEITTIISSQNSSSSDENSSGTLMPYIYDDEESADLTPEDEGDTLAESRLIGQKCLGIITIDKINLVYAIVEGTEDYNIGVAIGHFIDTPGIGEEGNCALAGHNGGIYGRYFGDIKKLSKGDEVVMTNLKGMEYTYVVTEIFTCEPTDVFVAEDLGIPGKYLTMVTCTQRGTKRLIVRAQCTTEPTTMKGVREQR